MGQRRRSHFLRGPAARGGDGYNEARKQADAILNSPGKNEENADEVLFLYVFDFVVYHF